MSLTFTSCRCNDNKYYQDPVWRGPDYFVCFDDDDPPEIVVKLIGPKDHNVCKEKAEAILRSLGFNNFTLNSFSSSSSRMFRTPGTKDYKPHPAFSFFINMTEAPPPPNEHGKVSEKMPDDGVIYPFI